jgi:glycosyltransferase involved in cell wall biosynthesis
MNQNKKKILFISISLAGGGAEKILVYLINCLDKAKYDRRLFLFERKLDYLKELDSSVPIVCCDRKSRWDFLKIILKLIKTLRRYNPDIVISLFDYSNIVTILAALFSRVKCRLIICEHLYRSESYKQSKFGYLKKIFVRYTYRKADKIVVVSKNIKRFLIRQFGLSHERIQVIYNPIPFSEIVKKSKEKVDHPFITDEKVQVIIAVGRMARQKRFDRLIRAFSMALKTQENLRLLLLGKGELEIELKLLAKKLKVEKYIDFVGFKANPYAWMAKSDVFALSSEREGFPNVLVEAMVCGVSVVSTDCLSGPNEIIDNNKNGFLVPEENEELLGEALLKLVRDVELRRKFSKAGKIFAEKLSVEKTLPKYEELF